MTVLSCFVAGRTETRPAVKHRVRPGLRCCCYVVLSGVLGVVGSSMWLRIGAAKVGRSCGVASTRFWGPAFNVAGRPTVSLHLCFGVVS